MASGQLLSVAQMIEPLTQGARVLEQDVKWVAPVLADNGTLVPVTVQVQSPMTPQDHVTHIHLLSQRNPVTRMAVFIWVRGMAGPKSAPGCAWQVPSKWWPWRVCPMVSFVMVRWKSS